MSGDYVTYKTVVLTSDANEIHFVDASNIISVVKEPGSNTLVHWIDDQGFLTSDYVYNSEHDVCAQIGRVQLRTIKLIRDHEENLKRQKV